MREGITNDDFKELHDYSNQLSQRLSKTKQSVKEAEEILGSVSLECDRARKCYKSDQNRDTLVFAAVVFVLLASGTWTGGVLSTAVGMFSFGTGAAIGFSLAVACAIYLAANALVGEHDSYGEKLESLATSFDILAKHFSELYDTLDHLNCDVESIH